MRICLIAVILFINFCVFHQFSWGCALPTQNSDFSEGAEKVSNATSFKKFTLGEEPQLKVFVIGSDNNIIWSNPIIDADDQFERLSWGSAFDFCLNLNPEDKRAAIKASLVNGEAPDEGYFLPRVEEYILLRESMGARPEKDLEVVPQGYQPTGLVGIGLYQSWTSSPGRSHKDESAPSYSYRFFNGRIGAFGTDYGDKKRVARCVRKIRPDSRLAPS